jgi:hypothetical protein
MVRCKGFNARYLEGTRDKGQVVGGKGKGYLREGMQGTRDKGQGVGGKVKG